MPTDRENSPIVDNLIALVPVITERTHFLISISLIFTLVLNHRTKTGIYHLFAQTESIFELMVLCFLLIFPLVGILTSISHAFTTRALKQYEIKVLINFVIVSNIFAAIASSFYLTKEASGLMLFGPIINVITGFFYIIIYHASDDHQLEEKLDDSDATFTQVFIGFLLIMMIFVISHIVCHLHWTLFLSISILYSTNVHELIISKLNL